MPRGEKITCLLCGKTYRRADAMTLFRHVLNNHRQELLDELMVKIGNEWSEQLRRAGAAAAESMRKTVIR